MIDHRINRLIKFSIISELVICISMMFNLNAYSNITCTISFYNYCKQS
uniref:G_PROTEIN_RECEP_F1_2 domain-containing protein n=1 Tax=Heterorhabditis bacteriophora TaxID=37862 RepID=A0A1I7WDR9_HETBA